MSRFERFLRRYPATITLAVLLVVALWLLASRWHESRECKSDGGVYVQTFGGWECVR